MLKRTLVNQTPKKVGDRVKIAGWVHTRRDHGKLIFIDLRDRSGLLQVVFSGSLEGYDPNEIRPEWVVEIEGEVKARPDAMINPEIETGKVELKAQRLTVLNKAKTPPFEVIDDGREIREELRLQYRYLDLRRKRLRDNLRLRSKFVDRVRQFLFNKDFTEIETPYLTKATPEGARDFIVPSRHYPGKFFALPQSPQQYKQLIMVGGMERYFQIARAFRDEDLRADRGYEHTQIDIEISFADKEEIISLNEEMMTTAIESMGYQIKEKPFPRLNYKEVMEKHGNDHPDLRGKEDKEGNVLAFCWVVNFPFFEKRVSPADGWTFTHNPFSAPNIEHEKDLLESKNIENIVTQQYDLVLNGHEIGGGSIRAHKPEVLRSTLRIIGYKDEDIDKQFGHMLEALEYGAPPHGGIAYGIERIIMILSGEQSIREVQSFPQTSTGKTAVMDAPSELSKEQLDELGIQIIKPK